MFFKLCLWHTPRHLSWVCLETMEDAWAGVNAKACLLLMRFLYILYILRISQNISKRASRIHKLLTFPFRLHTQQRLVLPFCKAEVSILIKRNLNILFQITLVRSAISSSGCGISCVLSIRWWLSFSGFCAERSKQKRTETPPTKSPSSSSHPVCKSFQVRNALPGFWGAKRHVRESWIKGTGFTLL